MNALSRLAELFQEFPGIGPRQAKRFVYFLLTRNPAYMNELSKLLGDIRAHVHTCTSCFRFFNDEREQALCSICRDTSRDRSLLAVVSRDADLEHIEKSHAFRGTYFVLGGIVPILEKDPERLVRGAELRTHIAARAGTLAEVILAMSLNPEGEHTAEYVKKIVAPLATEHGFHITTLGRGLSTGTELEYSDTETLKNALGNRK